MEAYARDYLSYMTIPGCDDELVDEMAIYYCFVAYTYF